MDWSQVHRKQSLRTFTTLKAGGNAELFTICRTSDQLQLVAESCFAEGIRVTPLGWGSNVLPSDAGVAGMVALNLATGFKVIEESEESSLIRCDSGMDFQELFLKTAQLGLGGLEFAVGIPGTIGGALVSNAGAYRSNVSEFLTRLNITFEGKTEWRDPSWMGFSYRDSILRKTDPIPATILAIEMRLPKREPKAIYDEAREYQRQRIGKQPPSASAGSFFKNVTDADLAETLPGLTEGMRKNKVVPAGFLIEACGLKGFRLGGAMVGKKHANFLLNVGGATATEIRSIALHVRERVAEKFRVDLEEEVLYLGDWSGFTPLGP